MPIETANLAGLSQAGAPVMVLGSSARPATAPASTGIMRSAVTVNGVLPFQSLSSTALLLCDVITVNITLVPSVDYVNIVLRFPEMAISGRNQPRKKRPGQYHHGDLQRALLQEALQTIQTGGVEQLTLRAVGEKLGVSRTALYRHFSDKQALLAAVGREGF